MADQKVTVDLTTGIGTLSFPRLFAETVKKNDKGEDEYSCQIIIPKSQPDDIRALIAAIKKVGEAKWGANWKKVRIPLRDGDKEKDELTEDGSSTKGEKYPERLGCYFLNAKSTKPIGVYDRQRNPIFNSSDVYAGCKVKVALSFYAYSSNGNHGVGAGLNGVQKIADGEAIGGGGKPSVESMFDLLEDDGEDIDLEVEIEEPVAAKPAAKKAAAPRKRAAAKPEPEIEDLGEEDGDEYADLEDLEI